MKIKSAIALALATVMVFAVGCGRKAPTQPEEPGVQSPAKETEIDKILNSMGLSKLKNTNMSLSMGTEEPSLAEGQSGYINYVENDFDKDGQNEILVFYLGKASKSDAQTKLDLKEKTLFGALMMLEKVDGILKQSDSFYYYSENGNSKYNLGIFSANPYSLSSRCDVFLSKNKETIFIETGCVGDFLADGVMWQLIHLEYKNGKFALIGEPIYTAGSDGIEDVLSLSGQYSEENSHAKQVYDRFTATGLNKPNSGYSYISSICSANRKNVYVGGVEFYPSDIKELSEWNMNGSATGSYDKLRLDIIDKYSVPKRPQ